MVVQINFQNRINNTNKPNLNYYTLLAGVIPIVFIHSILFTIFFSENFFFSLDQA